MTESHIFGYALPEMDVEAFLNLRDWLRSVIESGGTKITGTSLGCGQASLDIELDGMPYRVSIQPLPVKSR